MPLVSKTFDQLLDFTRTSAATYVGSNGLIQNTPASRNLLLQTQQFDNAAWFKTAANAYPFDPATASLGGELVVNGDFSAGSTGWTPQAGWSIGSGVASANSATAGTTNLTSTGMTVTVGTSYAVTYTISSVSGTGFRASLGGFTETFYRTTAGTYTIYVTATATTGLSMQAGSNNTVGTIDNISVREVIGGLITAPDSTSTADKLVATATTTFHGTSQTVTGTVASYTYSVYAKAAEYSKLQLANGSAGTWSATFDLATGATIATGGAAVLSSSIQSVGNGWYRCAVTFTGAAASTAHAAAGYPNTGATLNNFGASYTGDGTSGIFIWGAQLEQAAAATTYTRNNGGVFPPRFDYDPVTLAPKGLLIEEQRVNRTLQSEDFTVSPWAATVVGTSTRVNTNTSLGFMRGTITATSALGGIRQTYSGLTSGQVYALSFYVQSASTSLIVTLENGTTSFGSPHTVTLNPSTGTAGTPTGYTSVTSTPFGSGYIYTLITAAAGGTLIANFEWRFTNSGDSMLYGRPQFEAGAFATSYIPTVASQVTRTADQTSIVAPNFAPWYNQSEGTFVVEVRPTGVLAGGNIRFLEANDGTANNRKPLLFANNTAGVSSQYRAAGVDQALLSSIGGIFAPNVNLSVATAYATNDFAASYNGAAAVTDTSGSVSYTATKLEIGYATSAGAGNEMFNGHIRSIRYYPTRLTNAQLQALTA